VEQNLAVVIIYIRILTCLCRVLLLPVEHWPQTTSSTSSSFLCCCLCLPSSSCTWNLLYE